VTWAQAVNLFQLTEQDRDTVMGDTRAHFDRLTHDIDKDKIGADETVGFDEVFYKEHEWNPDAESFYTIHRLVFVGGKDEPVIDELWKGQKTDDNGVLIGALRYPIRKWAGGAALAAALFYLLLSGAAVPIVRSWIMMSIVLIAVMLDRPALTMRNSSIHSRRSVGPRES
jgi:hypothetical protein